MSDCPQIDHSKSQPLSAFLIIDFGYTPFYKYQIYQFVRMSFAYANILLSLGQVVNLYFDPYFKILYSLLRILYSLFTLFGLSQISFDSLFSLIKQSNYLLQKKKLTLLNLVSLRQLCFRIMTISDQLTINILAPKVLYLFITSR